MSHVITHCYTAFAWIRQVEMLRGSEGLKKNPEVLGVLPCHYEMSFEISVYLWPFFKLLYCKINKMRWSQEDSANKDLRRSRYGYKRSDEEETGVSIPFYTLAHWLSRPLQIRTLPTSAFKFSVCVYGFYRLSILLQTWLKLLSIPVLTRKENLYSRYKSE